MQSSSNKIILSALAGFVALSAPLAASAQGTQQRGPDHRVPAVNERQAPPSRGHQTAPIRPSAPAPQQQVQRPSNNLGHSQNQRLQAGSYRVTSTVNIRQRASADSRRVGQARAGRTVQVDRVSGQWLHIKNQGWISARYAEPVHQNHNRQPSRR